MTKRLFQLWFIPLLPGIVVLLGVQMYAEYVRWGMTTQEREQLCDACPEDPYYFLGLALLLTGIIPTIVLFIGGGERRHDGSTQ